MHACLLEPTRTKVRMREMARSLQGCHRLRDCRDALQQGGRFWSLVSTLECPSPRPWTHLQRSVEVTACATGSEECRQADFTCALLRCFRRSPSPWPGLGGTSSSAYLWGLGTSLPFSVPHVSSSVKWSVSAVRALATKAECEHVGEGLVQCPADRNDGLR